MTDRCIHTLFRYVTNFSVCFSTKMEDLELEAVVRALGFWWGVFLVSF